MAETAPSGITGTANTLPHRFDELRRALGEAIQRMLTLTLRSPERNGLVARTVIPTVPPRVEHDLTPLNRSLRACITRLTGPGR